MILDNIKSNCMKTLDRNQRFFFTNCINTLAIINVMELKDRPTGKEHFFLCAEKQKVLPFNVTSQPSEIGESGRQNTVQKKCFFNPRSLSEKPCNGEFYLSLLLYIYFFV